MLYRLGIFLCKVLVHLLFRCEVEGLEHVPANDGFILAANHRTNFDPLFVAAPLRQQVHFMAKAELFKNKFFGKLLLGLGAFPVERGKGDTGAIGWATGVLRGGGVLGMFPEGTRSKDGKPGRPKSGAAMIACQTGEDVLPCAVCYGEKLGFRSLVRVRYGKPIPVAQLGFTSATEISPHEIKEASRMIMNQIVDLLEETA